VTIEPLDPDAYRGLVRAALAEDLGRGDVTTSATVPPGTSARGILLAKSPCVVAGLAVAEETFRQRDPAARFVARRADGDRCEPGTEVAEVAGRAAALLEAERTALNFLQRLSGIATLTRRFVEAAGGRVVVLDTRKTTPTLRALEKYAVRAGGGTNHRMGLDRAILVKENHARIAGGIAAAVARLRAAVPGLPLEVEAQSLAEVEQALAAGADTILLDNLSLDETRAAVARCRGRARTEISGGVTLERLPLLAATGADSVSVGALTHSAAAADLSFELEVLRGPAAFAP
jgi:nicotinate-nucleotide pyrophosphorylase (carboxylating)